MNPVYKLGIDGIEKMDMPNKSKEKSQFLSKMINGALAFNSFANGIDMIVNDNWIAEYHRDLTGRLMTVFNTETNEFYYFYGTALLVGFERETGETLPLSKEQIELIETQFILMEM